MIFTDFHRLFPGPKKHPKSTTWGLRSWSSTHWTPEPLSCCRLDKSFMLSCPWPAEDFHSIRGSLMVLVIIVGQDWGIVADYWCHRCILRYGWGFSIMKGWNYNISEFSIHVEMSMTWGLWLACFPRNDKKHQCTTNRWAQRLDYWTGSKVCSKVPCGASYVVLQRRGMDW